MTKAINNIIIDAGYDKKIAVVDTPGIFDSDGADKENANDLVDYLKGCGGVNSFIVIGKPPRLDAKFQSMLKTLEFLLAGNDDGEKIKEFWEHVIFVITHFDEVKNGKLSQQQWLEDFAKAVKEKVIDKDDDNKDDDDDMPPIVIGVENGNKSSYIAAIKDILDKMHETKFMCDSLKSPFDDDKVPTSTCQL